MNGAESVKLSHYDQFSKFILCGGIQLNSKIELLDEMPFTISTVKTSFFCLINKMVSEDILKNTHSRTAKITVYSVLG